MARSRALGALLALLAAAPAATQAEELPGQHQALLLLRTLAFDRNLQARAGDRVGVCILYRANLPDSERARAEVQAGLRELARKATVGGRPLEVSALAWDGSSDLGAALAGQRCSALYVAPGLADRLAHVARTAHAASLLTFGASREQAERGLAVALVRREGKTGLVVNLKASREAGADLDSQLLQLSEVIR